MRFMVIVQPAAKKALENGYMPKPEEFVEMGKFNEQLVKAGVMEMGEGLQPSNKATRFSFAGGKVTTSKGPFEDSIICGFWIWNVKSEEEAIEWAKKAPMQNGDVLELRKLAIAEDFGAEVAEQYNELRQKLAKQQRG